MKSWHWVGIIAIITAYLIGVKFPATGQTVLSKIGM